MAAMTVRGISDETHRALKLRAAAHGRSAEAEVRAILDAAVADEGRVRLGSLLADIGHAAGGVELEIVRDRTPYEPVNLG
ncbi:plasmid stability protein [Sanguibacter sp. HDW7]|uniref:FitA-like ribbon-helix-helix domain-containing protein n=1 Tax=Sanguibacter sp. HDW7 TaxID=2714931 RepID=UPI0014082DCD|nr:plasmid stability protein [Sanguibacter sp. HDW7]QIK84705.1 plasmid stability protein [Sanguibacter sp. HDW7]